MTKAEKMAALKAKGITVAANATQIVVDSLYNEHFGNESAVVKAFNKIEARKSAMIADKNTNIEASVLSVISESFKVFDKERYLKNAKKQTQKDWCNSLQDGDGFINVNFNGTDGKVTPISVLLSTLKGVDGLIISDDNQSIIPADETLHKCVKGVILMA